MDKKLVIFGLSDFAQLAHFYFTTDSEYEVVAFSVDDDFKVEDTFCGLPVISFDELSSKYPADKFDLFIALGYSKLNQARKDKYLDAKEKGYTLASFVSSRASFLSDLEIGDNCFVFEDNTIQPFVKIENNVTLWSGNHIGHHSVIKSHCFIASHAVISGHVVIGEQCFVGVNATLRDHITVGEKTVIGAGALLLDNADPEGVYIGKATERARVPSTRLRNI